MNRGIALPQKSVLPRMSFTHQALRFAFVGVLNTLVDFGVYIALTRLFGSNIYVATTFSFIAAATFSFFVNKYWTFDKRGAVTFTEIGKFYGTAVTGFGFGTLTLFILVSYFSFHDIIAKVFGTAVTFAWNFTLSKFWVFSTPQISE